MGNCTSAQKAPTFTMGSVMEEARNNPQPRHDAYPRVVESEGCSDDCQCCRCGNYPYLHYTQCPCANCERRRNC